MSDDQRWREHLYEIDYLQEGINLRAMGQKDPLVEWQREGFEMFGGMMKGIAQDFVRYVMHVQVAVQQNEQPQPEREAPEVPPEPVVAPRASEPPPAARPAPRPASRRPAARRSPCGRARGWDVSLAMPNA